VRQCGDLALQIRRCRIILGETGGDNDGVTHSGGRAFFQRRQHAAGRDGDERQALRRGAHDRDRARVEEAVQPGGAHLRLRP
jgi:hypothetical protein